ncbi:MAG: hypothetical protein M0033_09440 [Nitrospiraceae bacterium]|nr:hypothetical protein [Nitrospiraceae bacterium]
MIIAAAEELALTVFQEAGALSLQGNKRSVAIAWRKIYTLV